MKRQRSLYEDNYHVYNGGVGDITIFRNNKDKDYFCQLIERSAKKYEITIHAYAIMDNHFHIAANIPDFVPFSNFMRDVCAPYARYYNRTEFIIDKRTKKKKKRHGAVFAESYKTVPVNSILQNFRLTNYIHNNPRSFTDNPMEYIWSSYMDYLGYYNAVTVVKRNYDIMLDMSYFSNISHENFVELMKYDDKLEFSEDELQSNKYMTDSVLFNDMKYIFKISGMDIRNMPIVERNEWLYKLSQIPGTYMKQLSRVTGLSYSTVRKGIKDFTKSTKKSTLKDLHETVIDTIKEFNDINALITE